MSKVKITLEIDNVDLKDERIVKGLHDWVNDTLKHEKKCSKQTWRFLNNLFLMPGENLTHVEWSKVE